MKIQKPILFEVPFVSLEKTQDIGDIYKFDEIASLDMKELDFEAPPSSKFISKFIDRYKVSQAVMNSFKTGLFHVAIQQAIYAGIRDEVKLTDMIFYWVHNKRNFKKINPNLESKLVEKWKAYRDGFVRPLLTSSSTFKGLPDPLCNIDPYILNCFPAYEVALQPWHEEQLDRISIQITERYIDQKPIGSILVIGNAANFRSSDNKFSLGVGRSMSVRSGLKKRLNELGPDFANLPIIPISLADVRPIATNKTQAGRRLNRRVKVLLLQAPPPKAPEHCSPLSDAELDEITLVILGQEPKEFIVGRELYKAIKKADNKLCQEIGKRLGPTFGPPARLFCMFLNIYIDMIVTEFKSNPTAQVQFVRGSAYALMDSATRRQRDFGSFSGSSDLKKAIQQGYSHIFGRIQILREDKLAREELDKKLARIACSKNRGRTTTIIYRSILRVVLSQSLSQRSQIYIDESGNCILDYPLMRNIRCGPFP